jgi:uncharacterized protein
MHILAFADTHLDKKSLKEIIQKSKDADLVICAGDISWFGQGLKEFLTILNKKIKQSVYFIHGNHEEGEPIKTICKPLKNIHFVHKQVKKIQGYTIFFWGGGGFAQVNPQFEKATTRFKKAITKNDKVILVTHGPAYKSNIDFLPWCGHVGSKSQRKFIKSIKPILHLSGHLHEHIYEQDTIGETVVMNVGPAGTLIEIK